MEDFVRTTTRARDQKAVLVRLNDDLLKRFETFRKQNKDDESKQIAGVTLFEYGIAAFERGDLVIPIEPAKIKAEIY